MTYLFLGAEDTDFITPVYDWTWQTFNYRSGFARSCIQVYANSSQSWVECPFNNGATSSSLWTTMRYYMDQYQYAANRPLVAFFNGSTRRITINMDATGYLRVYTLNDTGTATELVNSLPTQFLATSVLTKVDIQVNYSATGWVRMYLNSTLIYEFVGNTIAAGSTVTNFTKFGFSNPNNGSGSMYYSEIIVAERDTRTLSLYTLIPNGNGSGNQWQGSYTDIDETRANETDVVSTTAVDQSAFFDIQDIPAGNYAVQAIKVTAQATRGITGPANIQLGVRSAGNVSLSPNKPLDTGWTKISETFETNPNTGVAWTLSEINALQIAARSKT